MEPLQLKKTRMENIANIELPKEMHNIKILAAIGLYKTESEVMKNSLRRLQSGSIKSTKEIRNILDRALGKKRFLRSLHEVDY